MPLEPFNNHIGYAIRERRCELGLTQKELARRLDISPQQIQRYECGRDQLNVETVQWMAHALEAPVFYFFRQEELALEAARTPRLSLTERLLVERFRKVQDIALKNILIRLFAIASESGPCCRDDRDYEGKDNTML